MHEIVSSCDVLLGSWKTDTHVQNCLVGVYHSQERRYLFYNKRKWKMACDRFCVVLEIYFFFVLVYNVYKTKCTVVCRRWGFHTVCQLSWVHFLFFQSALEEPGSWRCDSVSWIDFMTPPNQARERSWAVKISSVFLFACTPYLLMWEWKLP